MTEISFFLKKIYLICKKTEIDRIINGKSGERMGYRRFSNRLNKRIKNRKSLRKEDRNYWKNQKRVSKKYLAPSIYSYPYWRLKSNIRFYKGVFCLFGHPLLHSILKKRT